jgi:transcriptional regulator with XRE-family HTH domain
MPTVNFGKWLKSARRRNALTQADLAKRLEVSQGTISNWEGGKGEPESSQKRKLKSILEVNTLKTVAESDENFTGASIVGEWLSKARQSRGWSGLELAKKADVSLPTIYNIEGGRALNPHSRTIEALEKALGITFDAASREDIKEESQIEGLGELRNFDPYEDKTWPKEPGVYVLYDVSDRPVYIGQSKNIADRLKGHRLHAFWFRHPAVAVGDGTGAYVVIKDREIRRQMERILIAFLKRNALFNRQGVDREALEEDTD